MEAPRLFRRLSLGLLFASFALLASPAMAASARTQNFIVSAGTQELANEIAKAAEDFRRDLAIEWLGQELPDWEQPCPITAQVDPRHGAGGATSFMFGNGRPYGWTMTIQGSRERVLDSVLPHEVTHTIFATHFGRPLPRWADEGACTTVEHASERGKQEKLLYQFLTTNRGIAFNKMFAMKEYPRDILPLYSQGYALARYLIALEGKRTFVDYVGAGMDSNNWSAATKKFYGFNNLSDLQLSWLDWVRKGTPKINSASEVLYVSQDPALNGKTLAEVAGKTPPATAIAASEAPPTVRNEEPRSIAATNVAFNSTLQNELKASPAAALKRPPANELPTDAPPSGDGWYSRLRDQGRARSSQQVATQPEEYRESSNDFRSSARPQPPEGVKQKLLEWRKESNALAPTDR